MSTRSLFTALLLCSCTVLHAGTTPEEILKQTIRNRMRVSPEEIAARYSSSQATQGSSAAGQNKSHNTPSVLQAGETLVSDDEEVESEVHAALNPTDTANIIISPIRQAGSFPTLDLTCPIYYTKDFGKTWQKSSFRTVPKEEDALLVGGGDPMLTFDANGTAYVSWINLFFQASNPNIFKVGMYWASSSDGGATWTRAENDLIGFAQAQGLSFTEFFDKQWMAVDRTGSPHHNTLYCALFHPNSESSDIVVARKPHGAASFAPVLTKVSTPDFEMVQFTSIDIDPSGGVHVIFFGTKGNTTAMWHAVSTDGAQTFSTPKMVSEMHLPRFSADEPLANIIGINEDRFYPCPHFVIDKSNGPGRGTLYAVWTANGVTSRLDDGLDIYFARSTDNGATWSSPVVVNDDPKGTGAHQFYPSIAINDNGVLSITWYDRRNDPNNVMTSYYMTHSFNGGISFRPSAPVSTAASDFSRIGDLNNEFGIGEYTQVITTKGHAIPVWADGRENNGSIDIYAAFVPISELATGVVDRLVSVSEKVSVHIIPNPASERITVDVILGGPSAVDIKILDLLGRTVLTVADTRLDAGTHKLAADVSALPAGRYYVHTNTAYGSSVRALNIAR